MGICNGKITNGENNHNIIDATRQNLLRSILDHNKENGSPSATDLKNITLHECARNGDAAILAELLTDDHRRKHVNDPDDSGMNPLHYAARFNHYQCARVLVELAEAEVEPTDREGATPLHYAARKKQIGVSEDTVSLIKLLIRMKADVNAETQYGSTPLHFAAMRGNETVTVALLECEDINVNAEDKQKATPLHEAATYNQIEEAKLLVASDGCIVEKADKELITSLHLAALTGNGELCSFLIESVPEINRQNFVRMRDIDDNTALHFAIENRSVKATRVLIEHGASVNGLCRQKTSSTTALHLAAITGEDQIITLLIDSGANVNAVDSNRSSPLHKAVEYQNSQAVKLLLEASGTSLESRDDEQYTPLLVACCYESPRIVKELLSEGADVTSTEHKERNVLHLAAEYDQYRVIKVFLKHLEKIKDATLINSTDRSGSTALHIAASKGHDKVVRYLIQHPGIDIDIKNEDEEAPFHVAAEAGHMRICEALLKKSEFKCLNDEDEDSNTALHMAARAGHIGVVELLIKSGADKEARNCDQQTPLDFAAENGHHEIVQVLLDNDVPVDPTDKFEKQTPLHLAARNGHARVIETLLKWGANVTTVDKNGKNALDNAIDHGQNEAAAMFIKSPKWRECLINIEGSNQEIPDAKEKMRKREKILQKHITPMRKLIKNMPDVAQMVFDNCIKRGPEKARPDDEEFFVEFNFEFLDDTLSGWTSEVGSENIEEQDQLYKGNPFRNAEPYTSNKSHIKDNHPLTLMVEHKQESLLSHPLVLSLISHKWKVANYFYMSFLIFYAVFLGLFSAFVIEATPPYLINTTICTSVNTTSLILGSYSDSARLPIIILAGIGVMIELFQLFAIGTKYFGQWINILDWFTYISAILVVSNLSSCGTQLNWQWQLSAFGVFTAWIDLLLFLRRFPKLGIYVVMVVEILRTFMKFFIIFFLFIVAFGISFYILLQNQAAFRNPFDAIVKTWVMMIGEMDFGDIFHAFVTEGDGDPFNRLYFPGATYAVFLVFLVLMTIIIMNLLTGLAVDDVSELQEHAQLQKLSMQIDLALDVEIACPTKLKTWWHCIVGKKRFYPNEPKSTCEIIMTYLEEVIQGQLARSRYVGAAIAGKMTTGEDLDDPRMVEFENRLSRKVEGNSRQLTSINDRLEALETLLRNFIVEQRGGRGGDITEPED